MDGSERTRGAGGILDGLLELLFPTRCVFCRRLSGKGDPVCAACREKYPDVPKTGQIRHLPGLDCVSPLWYAGRARDALLRYKFRDCSGYASVFGKFMRKCLDENRISCDSITWVPLSARRLRRRGYDQAQRLAEAVGAELGMRPRRILKKLRNNPAQSGISAPEQRRANVLGVYAVRDREAVRGQRILLIDDVTTTGATLSECCRTLLDAGAAQVYCAVLARSHRE